MKNTKVVVIDSGIANYSGAYTHIIESYAVIRGEDDEIKIQPLYQWQEEKGLVQAAPLMHREKLERAGVKL